MEVEATWQVSADSLLEEDFESLMKEDGDSAVLIEEKFLPSKKWSSDELLVSCQELLEETCSVTSAVDNINESASRLSVDAQLDVQYPFIQIESDLQFHSDVEIRTNNKNQCLDTGMMCHSHCFTGQFPNCQFGRTSLTSPSHTFSPFCHHYHDHHQHRDHHYSCMEDEQVFRQYQKYIYDVRRHTSYFCSLHCWCNHQPSWRSLSFSLPSDVLAPNAPYFPLWAFLPFSNPVFSRMNADNNIKKQVTSCLINTNLGIPVFPTCLGDMPAYLNDGLLSHDFHCVFSDVFSPSVNSDVTYLSGRDYGSCIDYVYNACFRIACCHDCISEVGGREISRERRNGCGCGGGGDVCADYIINFDMVTCGDGMHRDKVMSDGIIFVSDISSESSSIDLDCNFDVEANIMFSSSDNDEESFLSFRSCSSLDESDDESIDKIGRWCSCTSDILALSTEGETGTNAGSDFSIGKLSTSSEPLWQWNPSYSECHRDDSNDDIESYSCTNGMQDDFYKAETLTRQVKGGLERPDIQHCQVLLAEGDTTVRGIGECAYSSPCSGSFLSSATTTSPPTLREFEDVINRIISSSSHYVDYSTLTALSSSSSALISHGASLLRNHSASGGDNFEREEEKADVEEAVVDFSGVAAEGSHVVGGAENRKDETATPNSVPLPLPPSVPVEPCRLQNQVTLTVDEERPPPPHIITTLPQRLSVCVPSVIRTESSDEEVSDMNKVPFKCESTRMRRSDRRRFGGISPDERDPWSEDDLVDRQPSPLTVHHSDVSHDTYSLPSSSFSSSSHGYPKNKRNKKRPCLSSKRRDTFQVTSSSRDCDFDGSYDSKDTSTRKGAEHTDSFTGYPDDMCHLREVHVCDSDCDVSSAYVLYDDKKLKVSQKNYEEYRKEILSPQMPCRISVLSNNGASSVTSSDACSSVLCISSTNNSSSSRVVSRPIPQPCSPPSSAPPLFHSLPPSSPPLPSLQQLSVQCQALEVKPLAVGSRVPGGSMRVSLEQEQQQQQHPCNAPNRSCGTYPTKRHHSLTSIQEKPDPLVLSHKYASDSLQLETLPSFQTQKHKMNGEGGNREYVSSSGSDGESVRKFRGTARVKGSGDDVSWATLRRRGNLSKETGIGITAINKLHISTSPARSEEGDVVRALPARVLNASDRHSLTIPLPKPFFNQYASSLPHDILKGESEGKETYISPHNLEENTRKTRNMLRSELVSWRHYGENECQEPDQEREEEEKEKEKMEEEEAAGTVSGGGWWTSGSCGDGTVGEAHDNSRCLGQVIGTVQVLIGEVLCHYPLYGTAEQCFHHGEERDEGNWILSLSTNNIDGDNVINSVGEQPVTMSGDSNNMAVGISTPTSSSSSSHPRPLSSNISRLQSSLYGFKIANNESMKVKNLIPLFNNSKSSSARDISSSVTFRVKSDSSWQNNRNRAKRNSDVCDMHMYRGNDSHESSIRSADSEEWADGGGVGSSGGVIKLCGVSLGSRPSSPEPSSVFRFHTLPRKSSHLRLSSLPPSPQPVLSPLAAATHSSEFVSSLPSSPRLPQVPDYSPVQEVPEPFPSSAMDNGNKRKDNAVSGDGGDDGDSCEGGTRGEADGTVAQQPLAIAHTMLTHSPPPPEPPPPRSPSPLSLQPPEYCRQYTTTESNSSIKSDMKMSDNKKILQHDYFSSNTNVGKSNNTAQRVVLPDNHEEHYSDSKEIDNKKEIDTRVNVNNEEVDSVNSKVRMRPAIPKNICTDNSSYVNEVKCMKSTSNENETTALIDKGGNVSNERQSSFLDSRRHVSYVENKTIRETEKSDLPYTPLSISDKKLNVNEKESSILPHTKPVNSSYEEYPSTLYEECEPRNESDSLFSKANETKVTVDENVYLSNCNLSDKQDNDSLIFHETRPSNTTEKENVTTSDSSFVKENENIVNAPEPPVVPKDKNDCLVMRKTEICEGEKDNSKQDSGCAFGNRTSDLVSNENESDCVSDQTIHPNSSINLESSNIVEEKEQFIDNIENSQHLSYPSSAVASVINNNNKVGEETSHREDILVDGGSDFSQTNDLIETENESALNPKSNSDEINLSDVIYKSDRNNVKTNTEPEKLVVEDEFIDICSSRPAFNDPVITSNVTDTPPMLKAGTAAGTIVTTAVVAATVSAAIKVASAAPVKFTTAVTDSVSRAPATTAIPVTAVSTAKINSNVTSTTVTEAAAVTLPSSVSATTGSAAAVETTKATATTMFGSVSLTTASSGTTTAAVTSVETAVTAAATAVTAATPSAATVTPTSVTTATTVTPTSVTTATTVTPTSVTTATTITTELSSLSVKIASQEKSCDRKIISGTPSKSGTIEDLNIKQEKNESLLQKAGEEDGQILSDISTATTECVNHDSNKSVANKSDDDLLRKPSFNKSDSSVVKKRSFDDSGDSKCRSDVLISKPRSREGSLSMEGSGGVIARAAGISERAALITRQQQVGSRPRTRTTHFPLDIICSTKMQYQQTRQRMATYETAASSSPSSSSAHLTSPSSSSHPSSGGGGITRLRLSSLGQVEPLKFDSGGGAMRSKSASRIGTDIKNDTKENVYSNTIKQQDKGINYVSHSKREDEIFSSFPCSPVAPLGADLTNKIRLTIDSCTRSVSPSHKNALPPHPFDINNQLKEERISKGESKEKSYGGEDAFKPHFILDQPANEIIEKMDVDNSNSFGEFSKSPITKGENDFEDKVSSVSDIHKTDSILNDTSDICVTALVADNDEEVINDKRNTNLENKKKESSETSSSIATETISATAATSSTQLTTLESPSTDTITITLSSAATKPEIYQTDDVTTHVSDPNWNRQKSSRAPSDNHRRKSVLSYENNILFIDEGDSEADSSHRDPDISSDDSSSSRKNTSIYETTSNMTFSEQPLKTENAKFKIDQRKAETQELASNVNQNLDGVDVVSDKKVFRKGDSLFSFKDDSICNDSANQHFSERKHLEKERSEPLLMEGHSEPVVDKYELQKDDNRETDLNSKIMRREDFSGSSRGCMQNRDNLGIIELDEQKFGRNLEMSLVKPLIVNDNSAEVPNKTNSTLNVSETLSLVSELMNEILENVFHTTNSECCEDKKNEYHNETALALKIECAHSSSTEVSVTVTNAQSSSHKDGSLKKRTLLERDESAEEYEQALEVVTPDPGHGFSHSSASVATVVRVDTPSYMQPRPSFEEDEAEDEFVDAKEEVCEVKCADSLHKQFQEHSKPQGTVNTDCQIMSGTLVDASDALASCPSGSPSLDVILPFAGKAAFEMITKTTSTSSATRPDSRQPLHAKQKESNVVPEDGSASSGGHVTDPDMLASASASSTGSEFSWTSGGGPVARRDLLPLDEDEDEVHWRALLAVNPPDSDEERTGYESDEDFDTMDAEMRRLEEKLRRFQCELGESAEDENKNSSQGKPSAGPLLLRSQDIEALRISPLPKVFPAVCTAKTKHLSLMTRLQVQEYEESCSGSDSDSDDAISSEDSADFLFVKTKIKLKPGERKCRSLDQKRPKNENILNEESGKVIKEDHSCACEEALNLSSLALPGETIDDDSLFSGCNVPDQLDIPPPPDFGNIIFNECESHMVTCSENPECSISVDDKSLPDKIHDSDSSTLLGYIWHEDDGMAAVDFEGLEDFYSYEGQGALMIMFEDDMDDDCMNRDSFEETEISENFGFLQNQSLSEDQCKTDSESVSSNSRRGSNKSERTFVAAFKNSLKKASKYLGPSIENPFKKVGSPTESQFPEWSLSNNNNSVDTHEKSSHLYSHVPSPSEEDGSAGVYNVQSGKVTPAQAFFPYSDNDGRDITSCSSGEYYAAPAVCVNTSDEDPAIPPPPSTILPPAPPPRWVNWKPSVPKEADPDKADSCFQDVSWFASPVPTALPQTVKVHHELTSKALPPPLPPPVGYPQTAIPPSDNDNEMQFYLVGIPKETPLENINNKHMELLASKEYNEIDLEPHHSVLDSGFRPNSHILNQELTYDSLTPCSLLTHGSCSCSSHCPSQRLLECDSNILPCLFQDDSFSHSQPAHKPTSVKQLKRKQQEKMLRNEAEEGVAALGCTFCMGVPVTRARPPENSAHWRQPSPHPKAITDRRSWPPRK